MQYTPNILNGNNILYNILDVYIELFFFIYIVDRKIFCLFYSLLRKSKMSISRRMDKEAVVHIHHGILLSH